MLPRRRFALLLIAALFASALASARDLSWKALDVKAHLDKDGSLHVVEKHTILFTGDWNGGERIFRINPGQSLHLEQLRRVDPDGSVHVLQQSEPPDAVDQFTWKDKQTLRWRSRLPSDPEFSGTVLVYEIVYTLSGILAKEGDRYLLDNDFAFPDRQGTIAEFSLALDLDPAWKPAGRFQPVVTRHQVRPGESVVVTIPLEYVGAGKPSDYRLGSSPALRTGRFIVLCAAIAALLYAFWRRESGLGRFAPLTSPEKIDRDWLDAQLLSLAPEEAGALWDETIGPAEVAAVLARLSAEKKISTTAEGKKLTMRLLVPLDHVKGYDRDLLKAFFFGGVTETDTDAIRKHYRSTGFDPAGKIREGIEKSLRDHAEFQDKAPRPDRWLPAALILSALATLALSVIVAGENLGTVVGIVIFHGLVYALGAVSAWIYSRRITTLGPFSALILWVPALFVFFTFQGLRDAQRTGLWMLAALLALRIGIVWSLLQIAMTKNGPKKIARRKALASARGFFARELSSPAPRLEDAWFPYVVALGLTSQADRWFRAHGAASTAAVASTFGSGSSSSSSSSSSSGGGWTGGGGAFGGAGASGSWAVAAGALASGVSAPSSSSGGGGGGGGGGSSGGGGGGGW
ncbi:MAG TPA: DUF2207 domain-containing protein [Thermoanaerobaculia bacterium]|nr:DUF2207 domain-containing protein [Thermoanaerobaculia bacterium]